jgi:hypothetical protein
MTPSSIKHIAEQAVAFAPDGMVGGFELQEILELLNAKGSQNQHLANPSNTPRHAPLTGDEPVYGDFLLLDYCAHCPSVTLHDYSSLEDLEDDITGGGGITNHFTSHQLAFLHSKLAPYDIYHDSPSGEQVKFIKQDQYNKMDFGLKYPNSKIHWK